MIGAFAADKITIIINFGNKIDFQFKISADIDQRSYSKQKKIKLLEILTLQTGVQKAGFLSGKQSSHIFGY